MGQSESFTYNANGNRLSHTDFNGATHSYQYDINNRVTQINYADGRIESYQYDTNGNRTQSSIADDGSTRIWVYQYDNLNRLKQETKPNGSTLVYSYDAAGNKTQLVTTLADGSANTTTYAYDNLNRLSSVTDASASLSTGSSGTTGYGYDAVGNRTSISYPNNTSQTYTYDTLNRLTKLDTFDGNGALVKSYSYTLHPTGRRTQIDETGGRSTAYSYDTLYRLTDENITDVLNGNHNASYSYDKTGNRTQSIINGITTAYAYDANDRLTQTGGTTYSYDANGNTLSESLDGNTTTYTYNSKNHLSSTTKAGAVTSYRYNPDGIRHQQNDIATTKDYLVDQNRDYAQVLVELDNNTEAVSYSYGDDLISQSRGGDTRYYHYDGLGSTRALSDSSGAVTDSYDYEAFGDVLSQTGTTENSYLFTGEQFDAGLDQYYLRARYYDQGVGRFTQQDTYMGNNADPMSLHKYAYGNADPVNYTDPTGHFSMGSVMSGISIAGTLASVGTTSYDLASLFVESGDGSELPTAREIGGTLLIGAVGSKLIKPIAKLCKKNRKARRYCNFVVGYVGAELKMELLAQSKSSNWLNKKRKNTIVGAFDLTSGRSVADFNRGKDTNPPTPTHPSLASLAKRSVGHIGCVDAGTSHVIGNCAEFMAANKLLFGGAKRKAIRWTYAYHVDRSGSNGTKGFIKDYCGVCIRMFGVKN